MRMTLLKMVQNILSATDDDDVNSIGDTVSSMQVAEVIKETYDEMFGNIELPSRKGMIKLDSLTDTARPNYLRMPDSVKSIDWIRYNNNEVNYIDPESFYRRMIGYGTDSATIIVSDVSQGVPLTVRTDKDPDYWTTFDNVHIVFDSYDNSVDTTLQQSKVASWGEFDNTWRMEDDYTPSLDPNLFPLLLAEAKSSCFINQKGVSNSKSEQQSKRQRIRMQNDLWREKQRDYNGPDYSRKR
jgi:hypothetical protein